MAPGHTEHVKLNRPPLKRVICQLRFPTLLGFEAAAVRPLQRALEDEYPDVTTEKVLFGFVVGTEPNPTKVDFKEVFRFAAAEQHTRASVGEDFLALETVQYTRFADFLERWERLMRTAVETLRLRRQARLGLRYSNVIEREGLKQVEAWAGLIQPHLLVPIQATVDLLSATVFVAQQTIRLTTAAGSVTLRHGFPPPPEDNLPAGYLIDVDNYDAEPALIDIERHRQQLMAWDHQSYALLHSSVTGDLWTSFEPEVE